MKIHFTPVSILNVDKRIQKITVTWILLQVWSISDYKEFLNIFSHRSLKDSKYFVIKQQIVATEDAYVTKKHPISILQMISQ